MTADSRISQALEQRGDCRLKFLDPFCVDVNVSHYCKVVNTFSFNVLMLNFNISIQRGERQTKCVSVRETERERKNEVRQVQ